MMMEAIVIGGNQVSFDDMIGKGGEGEVYTVKGHPGVAVKIYNPTVRAKREDKIRAMVGEGLAVKTELVAYPGDVVTDHRGEFLGFSMRLLSGYRPLHELYSPKSRQRLFPEADYRFLVRGAINVARAVAKVHQTGCVIGDLNHSGVLVAQNATVALIDADSFQFYLNGKSYPCVVGVPDFTPPELHGKNLALAPRTIEHDNFGLAVAIFHLLFMGRHPYAGRYKGPSLSMSDAIAQHRFAFSLARQAATRTIPPPGSLTLNMFPDVVATAFEKAFGLSPLQRPGAPDWIRVLTSLEGSLYRCGKVRAHFYPKTARGCVWCKVSGEHGFDMFPDAVVGVPSFGSDSRGTEDAIREILLFRFPSATDLLPAPAQRPGPSSGLRAARGRLRSHTTLGSLMMIVAAVGFIYAAAASVVWIGLVVWGLSLFSSRKVQSEPFQRAFKHADEGVQRELDAFIRRNGLTEVFRVRSALNETIEAYKNHEKALARELMNLKSSREARQRQAYLDSFFIRRANIAGIGPAKTATLVSFGIETAADVNRSAILRVPGFGPVTTGKLLAWRREHESRFKYQSKPNAQDVIDENAVRAHFAAEKAKLESTIRNGLSTLRSAKNRLDVLTATARTDAALIAAVVTRAEAEQDLRELGHSVPASTVALMAPPSPPVSTSTRITPAKRSSAPTVPIANTCPRCGAAMRRRSGRYGPFWGCSRYPRCRGTRRL